MADARRPSSIELWDLSRLHDRVEALWREFDDLGVSKVDGEPDAELRKLCSEAQGALSPVLHHVDTRIGEPSLYVPDDQREGAGAHG